MEMKRLNGTGLRAAGYDEPNRKMVIETTTGTFEYANVSVEIYRRLMSSPTPSISSVWNGSCDSTFWRM